MNPEISVFLNCIEAIKLKLYNLYDPSLKIRYFMLGCEHFLHRKDNSSMPTEELALIHVANKSP